MGSSSGGNYTSGGAHGGGNYEQRLADSIRMTDEKTYTAEVNEFIQDKLSEGNRAAIDRTNQRLDGLVNAINRGIDGEVVRFYGGSVRKKTYVEGLSDHDILVTLNDTSLQGLPPKEVLQHFRDQIQRAMPNAEVTVGEMSVRVKFKDKEGTELQVLPAFKATTGIRVINRTGDGWSRVVKPDEFAKKLTEVNQRQGNGVVPAIRAVKQIQQQFPENARLDGYHLESIAVSAFENYKGPNTRKEMIHHLVREAAKMVHEPIRDPSGQSRHVDDSMGPPGSPERAAAAACLARTASQIDKAEQTGDAGAWKRLYGE